MNRALIVLAVVIIVTVLLAPLVRRWAVPEVPEEPEKAPRISLVGPMPDPRCSICFGDITAGMEYRSHECGSDFHPVCIERTGYCPMCSTPFDEDDFPLDRRPGKPVEPDDVCPVCGRALYNQSCFCGALVSNDDGLVKCPGCGYMLTANDDVCPRCGETFEIYLPPRCHACRTIIRKGQTICRCGVMMDNICPECGFGLEAWDDFCPVCGLQFEILGRG